MFQESISSSFTALTSTEIKKVSGGADNVIIVTGKRPDPWVTSIPGEDLWMYPELTNDGMNPGLGDYGDGGGGGGGLLTSDQANDASDKVNHAVAAVDDLIEQHGADQVVEMTDKDGNKITTTLGDISKGLKALAAGLDAGVLAVDIINGDESVNAAIHFAFGATVAAAAASAGASASLAAVLGAGAELISSNMLDYMEWMGDRVDEFTDYYEQEVADWVAENRDPSDPVYDNPYDTFRAMMGWPVNPNLHEY